MKLIYYVVLFTLADAGLKIIRHVSAGVTHKFEYSVLKLMYRPIKSSQKSIPGQNMDINVICIV